MPFSPESTLPSIFRAKGTEAADKEVKLNQLSVLSSDQENKTQNEDDLKPAAVEKPTRPSTAKPRVFREINTYQTQKKSVGTSLVSPLSAVHQRTAESRGQQSVKSQQ